MEAAEEAYAAKLQNIVETPSSVIGITQRQQRQKQATTSSTSDDTITGDDEATVLGIPALNASSIGAGNQQAASRFWNRTPSPSAATANYASANSQSLN